MVCRGKGRSLLQPLIKLGLRLEQLLLQLSFFVHSSYPISLRINILNLLTWDNCYLTLYFTKGVLFCVQAVQNVRTPLIQAGRHCNFGADLKLLVFLIGYAGVRKVNG